MRLEIDQYTSDIDRWGRKIEAELPRHAENAVNRALKSIVKDDAPIKCGKKRSPEQSPVLEKQKRLKVSEDESETPPPRSIVPEGMDLA